VPDLRGGVSAEGRARSIVRPVALRATSVSPDPITILDRAAPDGGSGSGRASIVDPARFTIEVLVDLVGIEPTTS
jgi:hypothetical protein